MSQTRRITRVQCAPDAFELAQPLVDELAAALRDIQRRLLADRPDGSLDDSSRQAAWSVARDALARYNAERSRCPEAPEAVRQRSG